MILLLACAHPAPPPSHLRGAEALAYAVFAESPVPWRSDGPCVAVWRRYGLAPPYVLRCGPRWAGVGDVDELNAALRPERSTE